MPMFVSEMHYAVLVNDPGMPMFVSEMHYAVLVNDPGMPMFVSEVQYAVTSRYCMYMILVCSSEINDYPCVFVGTISI